MYMTTAVGQNAVLSQNYDPESTINAVGRKLTGVQSVQKYTSICDSST